MFFFFSSRRRHTRFSRDWSSDVCSSDLERGVLGLVLAILIFSPLATGAVRPQDFLVVQWLTLFTLVIWGLRFCVNPKHRLLWPPVCWPVLLFMCYAVARYLTADLEYVARQETIKV